MATSAAAPAAAAAPLPASFDACVQRVRDAPASAKLTDAQRLQLYGLYKQATEGDNASKAPGLLDFVGRSKWNAWKALAGVEAAEAMQQYIACVASWFPSESGGGSSSAAAAAAAAADSSGAGGGELSFGAAGVSTMGAIGLDGRVIEQGGGGAGRGAGAEEGPRDAFYFAKRGLVDEVGKLLEGGGVSIDAQDEEGRSLLHWAVDGGHEALVVELLKRGADVALKDSQGDTALDYAELCEYEELAALLVAASRRGASSLS